MGFDFKTAAQKLLKVAERIEKEASDSTAFVCASCNHTATLTTINEKRAKIAAEEEIDAPKLVTVNDSISCPACEGVMSYVATEDSAKFYVEEKEAAEGLDLGDLGLGGEDEGPSSDDEEKPAKEDKDEEDDEKEEKPAKKDKKEDDSSDVFEPVDDQAKKKKEEDQEEIMEEEDVKETPVDEEEDALDTMDDTEDKPKPKKKKKKDKPDDGKANTNKEKSPKFEEMPKEAGDYFWTAVAKYTV